MARRDLGGLPIDPRIVAAFARLLVVHRAQPGVEARPVGAEPQALESARYAQTQNLRATSAAPT